MARDLRVGAGSAVRADPFSAHPVQPLADDPLLAVVYPAYGGAAPSPAVSLADSSLRALPVENRAKSGLLARSLLGFETVIDAGWLHLSRRGLVS